MWSDFILFSMANTSAGIQRGSSPHTHLYPRLHLLFRKTAGSLLIHQQKIENDFGKVDNISLRSSKLRMKSLMLWRENVHRHGNFNHESMKHLGTREQRKTKKVRRVDCTFENTEYKSTGIKSECLAAAREAKRKAAEEEVEASIALAEHTMKRKEKKAKTITNNTSAAPSRQSQAKSDEQAARKQAFNKCCGGCGVWQQPL